MLKLLFTMPIIGLLSIKITEKKGYVREQGMIFSIITLYISLYILLIMNNTNMEYQLRDWIDLNYIRITLGIDGISLSLIVVTTILIPILILLK
jgi:NADH-quinone oxidoreductase subunit M